LGQNLKCIREKDRVMRMIIYAGKKPYSCQPSHRKFPPYWLLSEKKLAAGIILL